MERKTLVTLRTVIAVIAIASAIVVSGAKALNSRERIQHVNQVVAALSGVIKSCSTSSAKDDICGTSVFDPNSFMIFWDLYSGYDAKVSITAKSITAWSESGGIFSKYFGFSDDDQYKVIVSGTALKSTFRVVWLFPASTTNYTQNTSVNNITSTENIEPSNEIYVDSSTSGANRNPESERNPLNNSTPQVISVSTPPLTPTETLFATPIPNGYINTKEIPLISEDYALESSFDRSGKRVAVQLHSDIINDSMEIYDTITQKLLTKWHTNGFSYFAGEFTPDGKLYLNSQSNRVQVRQVSNGKLLAEYLINSKEKSKKFTVAKVLPNPNGNLYSVAIDGTISIFELLTGKRIATVPIAKLDYDNLWNPNGRTLIFSSTIRNHVTKIYIYDVGKRKILSTLMLPNKSDDSSFHRFNFSPDASHLLAINNLGQLLNINLSNNSISITKISPIKLFNNQFTSDKRFLLGIIQNSKGVKYTDTIQAIDVKTGKLAARFKIPNIGYNSFRISPDGHSFFISSSLFQTTGLLSDAIAKAAKDANTAVSTKAAYLERIDVLCRTGKLSVANCLIARSAIQTGTISQYPTLKEFLEKRMDEATFLREFNK